LFASFLVEAFLNNNDSYNFYKQLNDGLVVTGKHLANYQRYFGFCVGPTGTNVMDVGFVLVK
jgi:glycerate-2-kinase